MYLVIANDTTPQLTAGLRWFYRYENRINPGIYTSSLMKYI